MPTDSFAAWPFVFQCTIPPVPKGRPIFGQGNVRTPAKTRVFERTIGILLRQAWGARPRIDGAARVELEFRLKRPPGPMSAGKLHAFCKPSPDLDNLVKAVTDAGAGIAWLDDVRISELSARKILVDDHEGFVMRISPV